MSLYIRYQSNALSGGGGGGGGSGSGTVKVDLYDPVTTSVTSGPAIVSPFVVDGVTISTGDTVLFSNLSVGNNEIYAANVSGPVISWTVVNAFNGVAAPTAGDLVVVTEGTSFANQIGEFNGTTWLFNFTVRYFNGTDYFEQSSINTSTLVDNTTNGTIFSVAFSGSENILVDYSIIRSGVKEIGTIDLTTDGATVAISVQGAALAATGVSFSSVISGSDIVLQYTTTSTGSDATMKYNIRRWSDAAGGPGGPPSYSGGASAVAAAGSPGDIQINSAGFLGATSNFNYDTAADILGLGGLEESILRSSAIADNQVAPATLFSSSVTFSSMTIEYSISRGVNFRTGRIIVSTDGLAASHSEDFVEQGTTGVTLSVTVSGGSVLVQYVSTNTGVGGTFKYTFRRWAA